MTTKEDAKRFLDVLQAYADGEAIQVRDPDGSWRTVEAERRLMFYLPWGNYRRQPKTKLCRVWLHRSTSGVAPWLIKAQNAEFNWAQFERTTPDFAGWLTQPLEYEP